MSKDHGFRRVIRELRKRSAQDQSLRTDAIILQTQNYRLCATGRDDWPYFLANRDSEGMGLSKQDVEEMIDTYFKERF